MSTGDQEIRNASARLETRLRSLMIAVGILAVLCAMQFVAIALLARQIRQPRAIEATKLVLRDAQNRIRAQLTVGNAEPILGFLNENGKILATVGITPQHQPHLGMSAADGSLKLALGTAEDGSPAVSLFGSRNKPLAGMSVTPTDQPIFLLQSPSSLAKATLGLHPEGAFALQIYDGSGNLSGSHIGVQVQ